MLYAILGIIIAVAGYFSVNRWLSKRAGVEQAERKALVREAKLSKEVREDNKEIDDEKKKAKTELHKGGIEALMDKKRGK